jgi:hypothetical protein
LLNDASDTIAPQVVIGLLQRTAMTAMPATMAETRMEYAGKWLGGLTAAQRQRMEKRWTG